MTKSPSALDAKIDELYRAPLSAFIEARQALAKTLAGDDKKLVAGLQKPLALPWVVNQTYWQARRTYDRLLEAGEKLRAAQVGALKGKATDVRAASSRHAEALSEAVKEATGIAESAGIVAAPDALRQMFQVVSTRESLPAPHGRFLKPLEPAGFEALAGIAIAPPSRESGATAGGTEPSPRKASPAANENREEADRQREKDRAAAQRERKAAIQAAEKKAAKAVEAERRARAEWEQAKRDVEAADRELAEILSDDEAG